MKKILLFCTLSLILPCTFAAVVSTACNGINGSSGCDSCFKEEDPLYTCNSANQNCNNKEGITLMSDIVINTAISGNKVMYDNDEGQIYTYPLQGVTWSKSAPQLLDMFQFPAAYIQGRENFTVGPAAALSNVNNAYAGYKLTPSSSVKWIEFKPNQWLRPDFIGNNTSRILPSLRAEFIPRLYTSATDYINHKQCVFYYVRFCGDGVIDPDKGEQCDNGASNGSNGNTCNATCQTITSPLSCTNLSLSPTTLTKNGGSLTATCAASISSGTDYKLVLKQGATIFETIDYQPSATKTFNYVIPENGGIANKTYSVDCFVKNGSQTDITANACNKSITVPGTVIETAVCNSLTLSPSTTVNINTSINFVCNATNASSYAIKQGSTSISTLPEGTMNFPTAGTYSIGCYIDAKTTTPASCIKNITITNPPVPTIPSIFIDKDDSTPGTPDSDGNDIQRVQANGTATFTIRVLNNGNEALRTVVIDDTLASDCARSATQTANLYTGGSSANFDIGETFTYQCSKNNVTNSTFTNNRNTASVKGAGVISSTNVSDSDVTEVFLKQINPGITIEKDDTDNLDDEQEIDEDETVNFSVKVTNDGDEVLENIIIKDDLSRDCERDETETRNLIRNIGNKDSLFDPGEKFAYTCRERSVGMDTFPDDINTVCVDANGVDTNQDVDDCDDTNITVKEGDNESLMCSGIESSEGTFGGAPFRTTISCDVEESSSCIIEITKNGEVIHEYDACSKNITLSETGDYSVACIVDEERADDCEMEITIEAMTEIATGTKLLLIAFLSLILSAVGTRIYKKRSA